MTGANTSGSKWEPFCEKKLDPREWRLQFFDEEDCVWHVVGWYLEEKSVMEQLQKRIDYCSDSKWQVTRTDVLCQGRGTEGVYYGQGSTDDLSIGGSKWFLQYWGEADLLRHWNVHEFYNNADDALNHFDRLMTQRSPFLWRVTRTDVVVQT